MSIRKRVTCKVCGKVYVKNSNRQLCPVCGGYQNICEICGKRVRRTGKARRPPKYCKDCASIVKKERDRERQRKNRAKSNKYPVRKTIERGMNIPMQNINTEFSKIYICKDCEKIDLDIGSGVRTYCPDCAIKQLEIRHGRIYQPWADKVKKRDGQCMVCGSFDNLEAHHILPKLQYPEEARNIDNGITLCKDCHREADYAIHRVLGHEYNREQFSTWFRTVKVSKFSNVTLDDY